MFALVLLVLDGVAEAALHADDRVYDPELQTLTSEFGIERGDAEGRPLEIRRIDAADLLEEVDEALVTAMVGEANDRVVRGWVIDLGNHELSAQLLGESLRFGRSPDEIDVRRS
ncbi:hypothetical protein [Anaeromyxobacter dehalogenans]|uniref:hypothetical protein n=1 Tax=Anaeromyxobacter dehalogenans TaxID=161493 RepID=UPI001237305E|nr:hypothetical protein [Anaeromyxobacter dehalogenans]